MMRSRKQNCKKSISRYYTLLSWMD